MGLDASVMCRCLVDGKVALPRFAKSVKIDEEGYLGLDLPEENGRLHMRFHQWMANACAHPRMIYSNEHIGNWTQYRSFQQALGIAGWQHFPTLKAELPQSNGGITRPEASLKMSQELDSFVNADLGLTTELVDCATGNGLYEYIESYDGFFGYGGDGIDRGVDPNGFFIRQRTEKQETEIFRSMRFTQTLINSVTGKTEQPAVEFFDVIIGRSIRCDHPISTWIPWPDGQMQDSNGQFNLSYPAEFQVIQRPRQVSDYEYVVAQLHKVCRASVETGNPIRWV
jgi:hypothetical protein